MNPLYGLMLFGVAFFGFMVVVGVVQARRKKEEAYYLSALVSFLMLLSSIFVIPSQFILVLILLVDICILSVAGLPEIIEVMRQEPPKELQETDLSAPLRGRDLLTWKGWFRLASRWGIRNTMSVYSLFMMGIGGAIFFTLSHLRHDKHNMGYWLHNHYWNRFRDPFLPSNREIIGVKPAS